MLRMFNLIKLPIVDGIDPCKALEWRSSTINSSNNPIELGILPIIYYQCHQQLMKQIKPSSLLVNNNPVFKLTSDPSELGIVPINIHSSLVTLLITSQQRNLAND